MSISTDFYKATAIEKYAIILQERIDSLTDKVHQLEKELAVCKESLLPPPINCRISGGNYSQSWIFTIRSNNNIPIDTFVSKVFSKLDDADILVSDRGKFSENPQRYLIESIICNYDKFKDLYLFARNMDTLFNTDNQRITMTIVNLDSASKFEVYTDRLKTIQQSITNEKDIIIYTIKNKVIDSVKKPYVKIDDYYLLNVYLEHIFMEITNI